LLRLDPNASGIRATLGFRLESVTLALPGGAQCSLRITGWSTTGVPSRVGAAAGHPNIPSGHPEAETHAATCAAKTPRPRRQRRRRLCSSRLGLENRVVEQADDVAEKDLPQSSARTQRSPLQIHLEGWSPRLSSRCFAICPPSAAIKCNDGSGSGRLHRFCQSRKNRSRHTAG